MLLFWHGDQKASFLDNINVYFSNKKKSNKKIKSTLYIPHFAHNNP